ncbi:WD domain-containing protein [Pseudomassariella vexata]|uniref:WD domain-containing protein n=1 Tax=Pseudomassariella vexata TaxID=1141098 RepID=A0A1Y2D6D0_9PEZI|nr:WD domain-containing protein [Pseudomassariella vexata]ORY54849.1 WD domain-containing protein [Pseudomassariella vexata]
MFTLACVDGFRYPGLDEIYVTDIIPLVTGPATISSDQQLCFFNPVNLRVGPVKSIQTSHGNITCAKPIDAGGSVVCTAGENGSISIWDLRQDSAEVARLTDNQVPILSLACSSGSFSLVAGTELQQSQSSILIWDVRSTPAPRQTYNEVHSDDVTELNFHPSNPNILLSGSTDGLVNVCDTRITDEDEVIIQTFNHGASIHRAAFLNDTEVFALSHDERFALYNMAEEHEKGSATTDFGDMREVLDCHYVAGVSVKANGAGAVIGAGTHGRQMFELVHLSKGENWSLDKTNSVGLVGAHSSEIVRAFCFYDEAQMVFSVGEDGYIKAWKSNA